MALNLLLFCWAIWLIFVLPFGITVSAYPTISQKAVEDLISKNPRSINSVRVESDNDDILISLGQKHDIRLIRLAGDQKYAFVKHCRDKGIGVEVHYIHPNSYWRDINQWFLLPLLLMTVIWLLSASVMKIGRAHV